MSIAVKAKTCVVYAQSMQNPHFVSLSVSLCSLSSSCVLYTHSAPGEVQTPANTKTRACGPAATLVEQKTKA